MTKQLTDAEIDLAREIFLRTMQPTKTQEFNQQMAECSIRLSRVFSAAVREENRNCNEVEIDPIYTGISVEGMKAEFANFDNVGYTAFSGINSFSKNIDQSLPGELAAYPDAPRFDEMVSGFAKFDLYADGHRDKYKKTKTSSANTITCNYYPIYGTKDCYIAHTYPDWVVAKYTDKSGVIWGSDTDNLSFIDGYWYPVEPSDTRKVCILSFEVCLVDPENSLVSIGLPF